MSEKVARSPSGHFVFIEGEPITKENVLDVIIELSKEIERIDAQVTGPRYIQVPSWLVGLTDERLGEDWLRRKLAGEEDNDG